MLILNCLARLLRRRKCFWLIFNLIKIFPRKLRLRRINTEFVHFKVKELRSKRVSFKRIWEKPILKVCWRMRKNYLVRIFIKWRSMTKIVKKITISKWGRKNRRKMEEIKMEREFGLKSCLRRKGNKTFGLDYRADITQYNYYGIFKN